MDLIRAESWEVLNEEEAQDGRGIGEGFKTDDKNCGVELQNKMGHQVSIVDARSMLDWLVDKMAHQLNKFLNAGLGDQPSRRSC